MGVFAGTIVDGVYFIHNLTRDIKFRAFRVNGIWYNELGQDLSSENIVLKSNCKGAVPPEILAKIGPINDKLC